MKFFTLTDRRFWAVTAVLILLLAAACSEAVDWPNWRGPDHNGVSTEAGWRTNWTENAPKQLWKKSVGVGYSSLSVSKGRVYTIGNRNKTDTVWCLSAETGEVLWERSYPCGAGKYTGGAYGGPRATPTVDGKNVYTLSHDGQVFCLDADLGKVVWSKNLRKELSAKPPRWGFSGSPLVEGKLLILNVGTAGVALDKATGRIVWKTGGETAGYSTPVSFTMGRTRCVAICNVNSLVVLNAADGKEIWRLPRKVAYDVNATSPIISGNKMFISSGLRKGCTLLRIDGKKPVVLWQNKEMSNYFNNCVLWKGHIYGFDRFNRTRLRCLDFQTGDVKWSRRLGKKDCALMIADGKMIIMEWRGTLIVAEASPAGYKELGRVKILSGIYWSVPVLSGGKIFCRSYKGELVCLKVGPGPDRAKANPAGSERKTDKKSPAKKESPKEQTK
ncbi:MAG: PQQ-like beta-propeller repeat protein [Phycisphaerae bacterium]|nr:PQQ-like beta-propeller repeat protein [Phycisphaerae bacterium]